MYKCELCAACFATKDGLSGHLFIIHHEEPIDIELLSCSSCREWFTSLTALENHMMSVHKKNHSDAEKCPHCEKTYLTTAALLQHIICTHMKDQKDNDSYNCPFCTVKLKSISAFRDHIREHFLRKSRNKSSNNLVGDLRFKCHKCDAQLETTDELSSHLKSFHYKPKDFDDKNLASTGKQQKLTVPKKRKPSIYKSMMSQKSAVTETSNELVDVNKPSIKENQNRKSFNECLNDSPENKTVGSFESESNLSTTGNLTDQEGLEKSGKTTEIQDKTQKQPSGEKTLPPSPLVHPPDQDDIDTPNNDDADITDKDFDISDSEDVDDPDKGVGEEDINVTDNEDIDNPDTQNKDASTKAHTEILNESDSSENLEMSHSNKNLSAKTENNSVASKRKKKSSGIKRSATSKRLAKQCGKSLLKTKRKPRSDTNVECPHCVCVTFGSKSGLANHLKWVHKIAAPQYICNLCNKNFPRNKSLQAHMRTHEKVANQKCPVCNGLFISTELIDEHLIEVHKYSLDFISLTFETLTEFEEWKRKEETLTVSSFVKRNGTRKFPDGRSIDRFSCHRSGNYIPMGKNQRRLKLIGSNKTGFYCPAKIKLECNKEGIFVTYLKLHLGHSHELKRLKLSREEKVTVEKKLALNVPFNDILNEVRDGVLDDSSQRLKLLTKKDLYNFVQKYNLTREAALSDGFNLEAWINEMRMESNVIRAFKPVGSTLQGYKELAPNDFFLIVSRDCQIGALKKFGKFLVCFDWIKGINSTDNHLFTLTVIDELNESYPCAFLYSNRCDKSTITIFFKMIRSLCNVKPKYFMTDIAEYFFEAWSSVFDVRKTRLLYCNWHLDRAWRTALMDLPHDKQIQVYKNLKVIMTENDREVFKNMCKTVLNELSEDAQTKSFAVYFKRFVADPKPWARCYRICGHLRVCTTLENMHMVLKCLYLGAGKVLSPDKSIYVLMKYLRDLHYDRAYPFLPKRDQPVKCNTDHLFALHKTVSNARVSIIYKSNKTWIVSLGKSPSRLYEVSINKEDCKCQLICKECSFCIHYLRCACVDSSIKWNMCGHIHSVGRFLKAQKTSIITEEVCGQDLEFTAAFDDSNVMIEIIIEEGSNEGPFNYNTVIADYPAVTEQTSTDDKVSSAPAPTKTIVNEADIKKQENSSKCDSLTENSSNITATIEIDKDKSLNQNSLPNNIPIAPLKITIDEGDVENKARSLNQYSLPNNIPIAPLKMTIDERDVENKARSLNQYSLPNNIPTAPSKMTIDEREVENKARSLNQYSLSNNIPTAPLKMTIDERDVEIKDKSLNRYSLSNNIPNTPLKVTIDERNVKNEDQSFKKNSLPVNISNSAGPLERPVSEGDAPKKAKSSKRNPSLNKTPVIVQTTENKSNVSMKKKSLKSKDSPNHISNTPAPVETAVNKRGASTKKKSLKHNSSPKNTSNSSLTVEASEHKGIVPVKKKPSKRDPSVNNNTKTLATVEESAKKSDVLVKKKASKRSHSPNTSKMTAAIETTPKKRDLVKNSSLMQNSLPNSVSKTPVPLETSLNKRGVSKKEKSLKRISLPNKVSKVSVPLETTVNQGDISKKDKIVKKAKLNRLKEQTFKKFAKLLQSIETQEELELLTKSIPADRLLEKVKKKPSTLGS